MKRRSLPRVLLVALAGLVAHAAGDEAAVKDHPGLDVGQPAPAFSLKDQDGNAHSLSSLLNGRRPLAIVFFRSADW